MSQLKTGWFFYLGVKAQPHDFEKNKGKECHFMDLEIQLWKLQGQGYLDK